MIERRSDVRAQHAEQIEAHAQSCPRVLAPGNHHHKNDAKDHTQHNAASVAPRVQQLLTTCISNGHFNLQFDSLRFTIQNILRAKLLIISFFILSFFHFLIFFVPLQP